MDTNIEKTKCGGWIFLSHSHKDIALVRKVRNKFEELGFEPLMFYLKCLSDKDEIEELIKREIDERDWFVYLDSPNARKSTWVRTEREYIERSKDKRIFTIDLDTDISTQLESICRIANQMKVFISYSHKDMMLADRIKEKLLENDMLVLSPEILSKNYAESISRSIDESCLSGFVIVLVTESSCKSEWVSKEIALAMAKRGKVIPVFVGNVSVSEEWSMFFRHIAGVNVSPNPTDEELDRVMDCILGLVEYRNFV